MTAARKPHVHAKEIRALADGLDIQSFDSACGWYDDSHPGFFADRQYRVKPEKVYPTTQMTGAELQHAWNVAASTSHEEVCRWLANAALKHAIERQQVIPMPEVQEVARNLNAEQHKKELQAVAEAVYLKCLNAVTRCSAAAAHELRKQTDVILGEVGK